MPPRYFTVDQANRLLPELIPLLEELQAMKRQLDALREGQAQLQEKARSNGHNRAAEIAEVSGTIEQIVNESGERIARVNALGVEIKDVEIGLIDFLSLHQGRRVYLCWKLGELSVRYWHTLEAGYAGRQPIPGIEDR
ncbi:MAG: DUF2203 domain-containing protein [Dehalococcoidia bacterium]